MSIKNDEITVETGIIKILCKVWKKHIFPNGFYITWFMLSSLILLLSILSVHFDFIKISWLPFSSFIFPGVTGLSFSITMLSATRNLFSIEDLAAMFNFFDPEDNDISEKGDVFYRTLAPYITASLLWLLISMIALIGSIIDLDISKISGIPYLNIIQMVVLSFYYSMVIAGLLNLWYLISVHLEDVSIKVELELNGKRRKK